MAAHSDLAPEVSPVERRKDAYVWRFLVTGVSFALFGIGEAQKNLIAHDPQAQFALAQFGDAVKLTELTKARSNTKGGN